MEITGGCLCRKIRYRSTAAPTTTRVCWCRLCQYLGAGNGTVNVGFAAETFTIDGQSHDHRSIADSGNVMHRRFCPDCGTPLFSTAEARPHLIFVRAGTLDDSTVAQPAMTIWTSAAPSWACIADDLPAYPGQVPPASPPPA